MFRWEKAFVCIQHKVVSSSLVTLGWGGEVYGVRGSKVDYVVVGCRNMLSRLVQNDVSFRECWGINAWAAA